LTSLTLPDGQLATNNTLKAIAKIKQLRVLSVGMQSHMKDRYVTTPETLCSLQNLRVLDFGMNALPTQFFSVCATLSSLEVLGIIQLSQNESALHINQLASLRNLQQLLCHRSHLRVSHWRAIGQIRSLERLILRQLQLTPPDEQAVIQYLANLPKLRALELMQCSWDDTIATCDFFAGFTKLQQVEVLHLSVLPGLEATTITNSLVQNILQMRSLTHFKFSSDNSGGHRWDFSTHMSKLEHAIKNVDITICDE
jgi:hypothetical protein